MDNLDKLFTKVEENPNKEETRPYPFNGEICEMMICIPEDNAEGMLISAPGKVWETQPGHLYCEDFEQLPKERGIYKCKAQFYFEQGYFEGYLADGESDWGWVVTESEKLLDIPKYE